MGEVDEVDEVKGARLLDDRTLERSWVVANRDMNRQRGLAGVNSYGRELGFDPLALLRARLASAAVQPSRPASTPTVAWLDLCCGVARLLRAQGVAYDARRHRVRCTGQRELRLPVRYLGADDRAGPNYTGQPSVVSHYTADTGA